MKNKLSLFLATTALSVTPTLHASNLLPEIIVSATRSELPSIDTTAKIHTITQGEIERSGAQNIIELLRGKAGVHVTDSGSSMTIDMRGFGGTASANTLVMVDGRKMNTASDGATLYLNSIDLETVQQIEVIQGSAGILFGNQAVGGIINIITQKPMENQSAITLQGGSFNSRSISATVHRTMENGTGVRIQAKDLQSNQYRDRNQKDLTNFSLRLDQHHDNGSVFVEHQQMDDQLETPGALLAAELTTDRTQAYYNGDYFNTKSNVTRLGINHFLSSSWTLLGEVTHKVDDRRFVQSFRTSAGSLSTQDRTTTTFNPRLSGAFKSTYGESVVTIGFDYESTDYKLVTSFGPQANDQRIQALYGQLIHPLSDDITSTIGFRHAQVENDMFSTSSVEHDNSLNAFSAALNYQTDGPWSLFIRADQNYRFAKVDEHTNTVWGQPMGLKDQTGVSYEAGASLIRESSSFSLSGYQLELENEIGFDSSGFTNISLPETRRRGAHLAAEHHYNQEIEYGLNYDFTDNKVTAGSFSGNKLPLVPEHRATIYTNWDLSTQSNLRLELLHVGPQVVGSDYSNSFDLLPSYNVVNLFAQHQYQQWDLSFKINNLLDKKYSETASVGTISYGPTVKAVGFNPSPERNFMLTARYNF